MKNTTISRIRNAVPFRVRQWYFGLMILCALGFVTGSYGQTGTIPIGSGTGVDSYLMPVRAYYGYSYSQQIVTAAEFGAGGGVAGPITKIRYYVGTPSTPFTTWNNWTIYMKHTSKSSFSGNTDWETVSATDQVFSGTITPLTNGWMEITLATPFNYNGTSNIVIGVDENAALYSDYPDTYFGSYTSASNTGIYYYNDDTNPNPTTPPTASGRTSTLPRLQLVGNLASCLAPTGVTAVATGTTTGTATWTAAQVAPANGYQYYQSSTNTPPTASTTPTGSVGAGVTTTPLTNLTANTTFYVWVRSACGASTNSSWSAAGTLTTPCDAVNVPYLQNFESATVPGLPECTSIQNVGTGNLWNTINAPGSGFNSKTLRYSWNGTNAANVWFYTRGVNLTAGTSYRISYRYGNNSASTYTERLKVSYGTASNAAAMTNQLANHSAVTGASAISTYTDFVPATTGVYYFGFNAYSIANQDQLYVDDISVTVSPTCLTPTALVAGASTETGVSLSWTASTTNPTGGYQYYYSTSNTAPTESTTASGSLGAGVVTASIGSLTSSTKYYVWVRSNCGAGSFSEWAGPIALTTLCDAPDIVTTTTGSICGEGSVQLSATSSGGTLKWYAAATGGAALGTGATFNTPSIDATTTFYVEAVNASNAFVGAIYSGTTNNGVNVGNHGIRITTTQPNITINSADIPFSGTGTMTIAVKDATNTTVIASVTTGTLTGNGSSQTVPLNLTIPNAGTYILMINSVTGSIGNLGYSTGTYPYTTADGSFSILGGYWYGNDPSNMYLFNLNVVTGCASPRQAVIATVTPAPAVTASVNDSTICAGESVTLSATSPNANYTYVWMPGNLTGATQTVSPATTTTYTVTATDAGTGCVAIEQVTVNVNILPSALVLADNASICEGGAAVPLAVQGGVTQGTILTENFNAATNNWITINNSTGGTPANAAFTLRADGYVYGGNTYHSNDNSQFYFTNSDSQGSGSVTATILQSPSFSTVGYTSASISFYHYYYEPFSPSTGKIEVSLDGTTWTTLQTYETTTGSWNAFAAANITIPAAFLNQATVYMRFKYDGAWRYYWAIDSVSISGQQSGAMTWAPTTGLYTDAAATVAYTGQALGTVYAKPTATTTYTVTATNPSGCSVTDEIVINISNTVAPTVEDDVQIFCNSATIADLVATGSNIKWYAAPTGGTNISANTAIPQGVSIYYASQTIDGCESAGRVAVATLVNVLDAPVALATQTFCGTDGVTLADLDVTGGEITWYADANTTTALTEDTVLENGTTYYASQTIDGCESSQRVAITVQFTVTGAPTAMATQSFCADSGATVENLIADGSMIQWYADEQGGSPLAGTDLLVDGAVYYASQTINGCEGTARFAVTAQLTTADAPVAAEEQNFCTTANVDELMPSGNGYTWYADETGGTPLAGNTALTDGTAYYVSQTINGCESERTMVMAYISTVAQPMGDAVQVVNESAVGTATIADIAIQGEDLAWYASMDDYTAGNELDPETLIVSGTTYYVTQTIGNCTSEPFAVTVTVALGNERFDASTFSYYPNPVKDVLNISYSTCKRHQCFCRNYRYVGTSGRYILSKCTFRQYR